MMTQTVKDKILGGEQGKVYFVNDFGEYHNSAATQKALSRLEKENILIRLSNGIYLYPKKNRFGIQYPTTQDLAEAIAERDRVQIQPTGNTALNMLGLSTQVPTKATYLTTGSTRVVKIGKREINFKNSVPKNFQYKTKLIPLIVFAFKELGKDQINESVISKVKEHLVKNSTQKKEFLEDIQLAPKWIENLLYPIINQL